MNTEINSIEFEKYIFRLLREYITEPIISEKDLTILHQTVSLHAWTAIVRVSLFTDIYYDIVYDMDNKLVWISVYKWVKTDRIDLKGFGNNIDD